jgi:uncharacterized sulfatase
VPKQLEGTSFRELLGDPTRKHKGVALTVVKRGPVLGRSVRTERYRYTEWDGGNQGAELYDHATDPGEWVNLADKRELAKTRGELSELIKTTEAGAKR